MNNIIKKPQVLCIIAIPIVLFYGILGGGDTISFNIYATYYIISVFHLSLLITVFFAILGLGYWIVNKADIKLSKWLIGLHLILTFGGVLCVWVLSHFYKSEPMNYDFNANLTLSMILVTVLVILGQLLFPFGIIYSLIRLRPSS